MGENRCRGVKNTDAWRVLKLGLQYATIIYFGLRHRTLCHVCSRKRVYPVKLTTNLLIAYSHHDTIARTAWSNINKISKRQSVTQYREKKLLQLLWLVLCKKCSSVIGTMLWVEQEEDTHPKLNEGRTAKRPRSAACVLRRRSTFR